MNCEEAISYIHSAPKLSKKLGNDALRRILKILGNPQDELKFIHIAGTNGKGSVAAMINSVLCDAGINTGLFTSPFLEVFNERIRVNSKMISDEDLAKYTDIVKTCMEEDGTYLSEFAIIFVIAVLYFKDNACNIVVLETGLGGRLDATNVISESLVSVITKIGLDHMQYLGNTKLEIAGEKCGIIKRGGKVVLYPDQESEITDFVKEYAKNQNAELLIPEIPKINKSGIVYENKEYLLSLKGKYQSYNAVVAIKALEIIMALGYNITYENIFSGIADTFWPGRFEWLSEKLVIDGCHNEDGVAAFIDALSGLNRKITIVTTAMNDKDYRRISELLSKIADNVIITSLENQRAVNTEEYARCFKSHGINPVIISNPIDAVKSGLSNDGICAVCGSIYLIGEVRKEYGKKHFD